MSPALLDDDAAAEPPAPDRGVVAGGGPQAEAELVDQGAADVRSLKQRGLALDVEHPVQVRGQAGILQMAVGIGEEHGPSGSHYPTACPPPPPNRDW